MKSKAIGIVKYSPDPAKPFKLSAREEARLVKMTDAGIDFSDIPEQVGKHWTRPGALIPTENKQQITLRLDADLLSFFKATGRRYQSRINAVLREYVEAQKRAV